jgi:hypothetical protein
MTALEQARERHQAKRERDTPGSLVFNGTTYAGGGLYLSQFKAEQNESGNWLPAQRFKLHVRKARMATPPSKKQKFTSNGHTWKIEEVAGQSPTEIAWIIKGIRWPDSPSA